MLEEKKTSMTTKINDLNYAEIQEMHVNHPDEFAETVKGLVRLQGGVTKTRKEVTNTANVLAQGKLVCLALKDHIAALKSKTTKFEEFPEYFRQTYSGEIPGAGLTLARAFAVHCLARETDARYVPESEFFEHCSCRVLQGAGKVAEIAVCIEGATPESSGVNHQVFTDVAALLNNWSWRAPAKMRTILDRLVWEFKTDGDEEIRTLRYLSVEELASRRATNTC